MAGQTESLFSPTCAQWIDDGENISRLHCRIRLSSDLGTDPLLTVMQHKIKTIQEYTRNFKQHPTKVSIQRFVTDAAYLSLLLSEFKAFRYRLYNCQISLLSCLTLSQFIYSMIVYLLICEVDNLSILIHKCRVSKKMRGGKKISTNYANQVQNGSHQLVWI